MRRSLCTTLFHFAPGNFIGLTISPVKRQDKGELLVVMVRATHSRSGFGMMRGRGFIYASGQSVRGGFLAAGKSQKRQAEACPTFDPQAQNAFFLALDALGE